MKTMDRFINRACHIVKDIHSYHRKFTYFQKIVILSLIVGIASIVYTPLLTAVGLYFVAIVATTVVCHLLSSVKTNFTFGVYLVNFLLEHEGLLYKVIALLNSSGINYQAGRNEDANDAGGDQDGDVFHDADDVDIENDNKHTSETKAQNVDISEIKSTPVVKKESDVNSKKELEGGWEDELKEFMVLLCRDFICDWYDTFEADSEVSEKMHNSIHVAARYLCQCFGAVDVHEIVTEFLLLYRNHLFTFQTARGLYKTQPRRKHSPHRQSAGATRQLYPTRRMNSIEEAFEIKFTYHIGVWGSENEIVYIRSVVSFLLSQLIPEHLKNCNTTQLLLVEILTCNVFLPVIELLSEPDFLHELIIRILSDEKVAFPNDEITDEMNQPEIRVDDDSCEHKMEVKVMQSVTESKESDLYKISTGISKSSHSLSTNHHEPSSMQQSNSSLMSKQLNGMPKSRSCQEFVYNEGDKSLSKSPVISECEENFCEKFQRSTGSFEDIGFKKIEQHSSHPKIAVYLESSDESGSTEVIETKNEDCDVVTGVNRSFTDIFITRTETATEQRSTTQYTLYVIQYDALYFTDTGSLEQNTKEVKRRFREFVNLQSRLEDNSKYKASLKDVKGPKRWLSLPFGNMDRKSVESRKSSLDIFLKSLIQKEDICNGPELKEFLGYEGDGHIAFVRKAPEISVPRFDKMIVRTVSGMIGKIGELSSIAQEKLPSLPGKKDLSPRDEDRKPLEDTDQINVEFCALTNEVEMLQKNLEEFIAVSMGEEEKSAQKADGKSQTLEDTNIVLAEAVLDLGVQALQTRGSWLCREKVVHLTKCLLGTALNRFLVLKIDSLTTESMGHFYLHLLKETIWPEGMLDVGRKAVKTDKHKTVTKQQARRCLAVFFPDILAQIVGKEDYHFTMDEIIESIQHQKLNKNFIFTFLDHLLEKLFPHITTKS